MGCGCNQIEVNGLMAYKLTWTRRIELGKAYKAGDIVDLSHYTPEQIEELLQHGQYEAVPDKPAKKS